MNLSDFDYSLPSDRIAQVPITVRDQSKLLVVRGGRISEDIFRNLPAWLPPGTLLVFNDTRVIRARLLFRKPTGGHIEIFCLEPAECELETAFLETGTTAWKCMVGNARRWREGSLEFRSDTLTLRATLLGHAPEGTFLIRFSWEPRELTFAEVLVRAGHVPLPPYIHRDDTIQDRDRYQTVYAAQDGSVAAPTAGLHFTPEVLTDLQGKGVLSEKVTLHVGAGTFKPITEQDVVRHVMHRERISVTAEAIRTLAVREGKETIAVGTTAARTLESLYWLGVRLITDGSGTHPEVLQWDPYSGRYPDHIPARESLGALLKYLESTGADAYHGETQLMIIPGYRYQLLDGLITNFHMPRSTLLLLVAALVGESWREAYQYALDHGFRFLSYGDACLFLR